MGGVVRVGVGSGEGRQGQAKRRGREMKHTRREGGREGGREGSVGAALLGHHPIPSHMYLPACLPAHPEGRAKVHEMARGGLDWDPGPPLAARACLPVCLPAYMEACLPACLSRYVKCVERRRGSLSSRLPVGRGKGRGRYREGEGDGGRGRGGGGCSERGSPPPGHWARCCRARRLAGGLEAGAHEGQAAVARAQGQARRPLPARPPAIEAPSAADSRQPPSAGRGRGKGEGVGGARLLACLAAT